LREDEALSDGIDTFNVTGLAQLIKALKVKPPECRVGILGDKVSRKTSDGPTNSEIGAAHEFGTSRLPQRSFLRVPIGEGLQKEMDNSEMLSEDTMKAVIKSGSVTPWLKQVAACAEACVADAFATAGGGKWPAYKDDSYENNTGQMLVDTHQLRDSITSEVK
jgi:phage gpG-like protein